MKMNKFIAYVSCILSMSIIAVSPIHAKSHKHLIQVVVDDTGYLQDELDPQSKANFREALKNYLTQISSQHGRKTKVIVISQYSSSNVWSGEARMIRRGNQNQGLQRFIQGQWGGCSDLVRTFQLLNDNTHLYPAESYEVVYFSSLIHSDNPCKSVSIEQDVSLPNEFLTALEKFTGQYQAKASFYWIFDHGQSQIRQQLVDFSRTKKIEMIIKSESETRSERF